ncbi:phosphosulfolactate synthase [Candidatus Uabimicrobium sp. HlEnr_7]|uniref:phosphosulfolactate synthase n=1 Tax=Candidatus Uabimicrobium helgolandensis TaxID=3095367 RepID=UPI0035575C95
MFQLDLPKRTTKVRNEGITHVLDKGLGLNAVDDLISSAAQYIDILKLGWGTSYITQNLSEKIQRYRDADIDVCLGGTIFECAYVQNKVEDLKSWMKDLGLTFVEVSDGSVSIPMKEKLKYVELFAKDFKVLSEIGSKDAEVVVAPFKWVEEIKNTLKAGAYKIVTEGRESGTVGVFRNSGEIRKGLIEEILASTDISNIVFEAPQKAQQVWFIKEFGSNVNLGNIAYDEVISLETIRLGLRGDTVVDFVQKEK